MKNIDWLDKNEYPFQSRFLELPMGKLHYIDEGQGAPIVFVHGTPVWSFVYRHLIKGLSKYYRCIALDHIGFGLSDKPAHWEYTPEAHSRNLTHLIGQLQLKDITLVVHDFGGPIGLGYAVNHSENIKKLVVLNTWMWSLAEEKPFRQASAIFGSSFGSFLYKYLNFSAKMLLLKAFYNKTSLTPALHQHYLEVLPTPASRIGTWHLAKELIASGAWFEGLWQKKAVLQPKPMLIIWGTKDVLIPVHFLTKWQGAFPSAEVTNLESGHFLQEEKPAEVLAAVKHFLADK